MFLTRISINHPVFATMMMVMILVLGLFSYGRLGVDHYPETDLPVVVVATTYTGASPNRSNARSHGRLRRRSTLSAESTPSPRNPTKGVRSSWCSSQSMSIHRTRHRRCATGLRVLN